MQELGNVVLAFTLGINSMLDIWKRQISLMVTMAAACFGIGLSVSEGRLWNEIILAFVPGGICMLIAYVTKEAIGYGDVWVILALGCFFSFEKVIIICSVSFGVICMVGLCCFLVLHNKRRYELPFVPFLFVGYLCTGGLAI